MFASLYPQPSRPVLLSGPMGSGKSTVGPQLAALLGVGFVDLDRELERQRGVSVAELFATQGEAAFRRAEAELARSLLLGGEPQVVALGGFTLGDRALRRTLLERCTVVSLQASPAQLAARLQDDDTRPLLAGVDKLGALTALLEARQAVYAECHLRVVTDGLSVEAIASGIAKQLALPSVAVPLGTRSYAVQFVQNAQEAKAAVVDAILALAPSSLVVVTDSNVMRLRRAPLDAVLDALLLPRTVVTLAPGEVNKTLHSVSAIWDAALGARIDRDALVIAYGGGVVGDLAGFAASSLLRGVRVLQIPTTVLSMLDSSVGGKTGFDHALGKNLIGAFLQPSAVVVDVTHASTLPPRELRAGLAEAVKIAVSHDAGLFARLEVHAEALLKGEPEALAEIARRSVGLKAGVVSRDETEQGERALLNLGHTVGHAVELAGGYSRWLHGEAVALGLSYELAAKERLGLAPEGLTQRVRELLGRLGLPTELPKSELHAALGHMGSDKKLRGKQLTVATLESLGNARVTQLPLADLTAALRAL